MENGSALSDVFAAIVEKSSASVVRVEARRRSPSSGIVWSSDGLVITAQHAVERDEEIEVGFFDGRTAEAKLVGRDAGSDVGLLRVAATDLEVPSWSTAEPKVGHLVLSVARPGRTARASMGIVSAVSGEWRSPAGGRLERYLQTDIALQPGFSGSLLVDARGNALGMNTASLLRGHSLAVPTETLRRVAEALIAHGRMRRAFVGLGSMPIRLPVKAARASGQESALLVIAVQPDGPADLSGVLLGDALLALDGQALTQVDDLIEALTEERIGAELKFRILRAGEVREIPVRAGARS